MIESESTRLRRVGLKRVFKLCFQWQILNVLVQLGLEILPKFIVCFGENLMAEDLADFDMYRVYMYVYIW